MRVGLLFPGEMGAEIGAAVRGEVMWASDGRSEATRLRAAQAGFEDVGTMKALVERSEIIFSVCPPSIAEEVASQVAGMSFQGLYVDANAIAPVRMTRIGSIVTAAGGRVVDGSIIGRGGLHLYLAGETEDIRTAVALFSDTPVQAIPLSGGLGAASALKMAFGGWNKIGIALAAQAYVIARAYGAEAELAAEGVESERILAAAPRAWRWAPEMDEIATTCAELGLPVEMARGAADLYRRWEGRRNTEAELTPLLDDLRNR